MNNAYLRTNSDCCLIEPNKDNSRFKSCKALTIKAFENYVLRGQCGSYECPFYKKDADKVRTYMGEK